MEEQRLSISVTLHFSKEGKEFQAEINISWRLIYVRDTLIWISALSRELDSVAFPALIFQKLEQKAAFKNCI